MAVGIAGPDPLAVRTSSTDGKILAARIALDHRVGHRLHTGPSYNRRSQLTMTPTSTASTASTASTDTGFLKSLLLASVTIAVSTMAIGALWLRSHGY
ncbi:MAG: hypothetical protein FJ137_21915 [Deltaproteobacteria bacterium]|nr:hypothetical protein [Deltaproteobacteria bacterium]